MAHRSWSVPYDRPKRKIAMNDDLHDDLPALLRRAAMALWEENKEDPRELGRILMGRAVRLEESSRSLSSDRIAH